MTALLEIRNICVSYGGIQAVRDLSLEVGAGEMVCLIGANGAGKTTTLKAISGLLAPTRGTIHFEDELISGRAPHAIARMGMTLVPEGRGIFPRMSVIENMLMGAYTRRDAIEIRRDIDEVYALLPRLAERKHQIAGLLSGGEQQMLALGRAMMARPRLLLLDEPSMGLAPLMVQAVFEIITAIAARGVSVFLVEQNAHLALKTCTRGYVMENGSIALADNAQTLAANPAVKHAYLGE